MTIAYPNVTASIRSDGVTPGFETEKLLIVGQMLTGTAIAGEINESITEDYSDINALFGEDSPVAAACRRARKVNPYSRIDVIALGAGTTAATGSFTLAGSATEDGEIEFAIGSRDDNSYPITIAEDDTATEIGDALVSAITDDSTSLVTAVNVAGVVTLTSKTLGSFGNTLGLRFDGAVGGVTSVISAMSGGGADPSLTGVFDVVGDTRYQGVAWQFQEDYDTLKDFLDARLNVNNAVEDGVGFVSLTDTYANLLTLGNAENSASLSLHGNIAVSKANLIGPAIMDVPFFHVTEFAAIRALRRTEDAVLGSYVTARSSGDAYGGAHTNSKPYANTPFYSAVVPDAVDNLTQTEQENLNDAGIWVTGPNRARNTVICGQVVTTYKTDSAGNDDPTFGFLNYIDTSTACREYYATTVRAQYPQFRANAGALSPGVDSVNEASLSTFLAEKNQELGNDYALVNIGQGTVDGEQVNFDKLYRENLTVSLDPVEGDFAIGLKNYIVVQARTFQIDIAIAFYQ